MSKREQMGQEIVQFEGRFDKQGRLQVYELPVGDGGGSFEIAGINERYHPTMSLRLKELIENEEHAQAHEEAAGYILEQTDAVLGWFGGPEVADQYPQVEFILRDTAFNRGVKGALTVLQLALDVPVDGLMGPVTDRAFKEALASDAPGLAERITAARESYERNSFPWKRGKRDESSKFWKGLENRWAKAHETGVRLTFT